MTTQDQVRVTIPNKKITEPSHNWYQSVKVFISRKHKRVRDQKAYRQLAQAPDHILHDMGISRADINIRLDKPWWWS